ncbi:aldo/keto reductase [Embleya hyalina]|uniref:Aldo/keto reductase n=1 Tax=Embleya hyalina TaxID=516124 RepID=A0A401Z2X0_9ACTN|nr:aldo/keto reductase [Embleya hyalina]GCE01222.1 aldo/keto reductase [Embleya hyalina]
MSTLKLGEHGPEIFAQGLGCMGMSAFYAGAEHDASVATLERALDLGVDLFDTSDVYGPHTNEELLGAFLAEGDRRARVTLATKFAIRYTDDGTREIRGDAAYVRQAAEASLRRLRTDVIDLYYMHRRDVRVPIEETVGAMAELVREGKVRHLGLSEVTAKELHAAAAVHPIAAVQSEWSLFTRDIEESVVPAVRAVGAALVAYSPLGRGFLGGAWASADTLPEGDFRRFQPRFTGDNAAANGAILAPLRTIAEAHGATPAQVALAWVQSRTRAWGLPVVSIPGTTKRHRLEENVAAVDLVLTDADLAALEPIAGQVTGARYPDMTGTFNDRD